MLTKIKFNRALQTLASYLAQTMEAKWDHSRF